MLYRVLQNRTAKLLGSTVALVCICFSAAILAQSQWVETDTLFTLTYDPNTGALDVANLSFDAFTSIGPYFFAGSYWEWGTIQLSTDGGNHWTNPVIADSDNGGEFYVLSLLANGSELFAGTRLDGVYHSTDSG